MVERAALNRAQCQSVHQERSVAGTRDSFRRIPMKKAPSATKKVWSPPMCPGTRKSYLGWLCTAVDRTAGIVNVASVLGNVIDGGITEVSVIFAETVDGGREVIVEPFLSVIVNVVGAIEAGANERAVFSDVLMRARAEVD